jgi:hypothetical protein
MTAHAGGAYIMRAISTGFTVMVKNPYKRVSANHAFMRAIYPVLGMIINK